MNRLVILSLCSLLLTACGGSQSSSDAESGPNVGPSRGQFTLIKHKTRLHSGGPIVGAKVTVDTNNNGELDPDSDFDLGFRTDLLGHIQVLFIGTKDTLLFGQIDDAFNAPDPARRLSGIWRAPANSNTISPLTELLIRDGLTPAQLADRLNLPEEIDVTRYDPIDPATPDTHKTQVLATAQFVADALKQATFPEEIELSLSLFDDHPVTRPILDLGEGDAFSLAIGYGDNHLFRITPDGYIWWRERPDFRNPQDGIEGGNGDSRRDNVYLIKATHTKADTSETSLISLEVTGHSAYENHPLNKAILDIGNVGTFILSQNYGDNHLFRVSDDGRLWWRESPDYEAPGDGTESGTGTAHRDNIYKIRIIHTVDGTDYEHLISLSVEDIAAEFTSPDVIFVRTYRFSPGDLAIANYEPPDARVALLLKGDATIAMPKSGPLLRTWSMVKGGSPVADDAPPIIVKTQADADKYRGFIDLALKQFEAATHVKFIEVEDSDASVGDLRIHFSQSSDTINGVAYGIGYVEIYPGVRTNNDVFGTLLHEIGHAMGLKHPFSEGGGGFPGDPKTRFADFTLMSYAHRDIPILKETDIAALQFLYGSPDTDFSGLESHITVTYD